MDLPLIFAPANIVALIIFFVAGVGVGLLVSRKACAKNTRQSPHAVDDKDLQRELLKRAETIAKMGHWYLDVADNNNFYWSDQIFDIFGLKPQDEEPSLEAAIATFHPDDQPVVTEHVRKAIEEGEDFQFRLRVLRSEDEIRHIHVTGDCDFDEKGKTRALFGVCQDITDLIEKEQQLHESQERLKLAVEGGNIGFWDWRIDTGRVAYSEGWASMLGYRVEELEPNIETWKKLSHPDDLRHTQSLLEDYFSGKTTSYIAEFRIQHKDGHWVWVLARGKVFERDADGNPVRAVGTHTDISELKRIEDELTRSQTFFKTVLNHIPDPIFVKDRKHRWIEGNDAFWALIGAKREDFLGKSDYDVFPREQADIFWEKDNEVFESGKVIENEEALSGGDGNEHIISTRKAVVENEKGEPLLIGCIRDLTKQKNLENEIEEQRLQAIQSSKMSLLGEMAAGVAHEINNPLAIISGYAMVAKENINKGDLDAAGAQLEKINAAVERVSTIVQGLKKFSSRSERIQKDAYFVSDLINSCLDIFRNGLERHNIKYSVDVRPDMSPILCNPVEFEQVIINLLINAKDAVKEMKDKWIKIEASQTGDTITLSVTDSGQGIAPEIAENIFTPFYTTKKVGHGTGLGLSISHGIIKALGGSLEYDEDHKNTRFIVTLKAHQPKTPEKPRRTTTSA